MAKTTQKTGITPEEVSLMLRTATCKSLVELAEEGFKAGREALRSRRNGKEKYAAEGITVDWRSRRNRNVNTDKLKQLVGEEVYEEHFTTQEPLTTKNHFDAMEKTGHLTSEQRKQVVSYSSGSRSLYLTDGRELSEDELVEAFAGFLSELLEDTED